MHNTLIFQRKNLEPILKNLFFGKVIIIYGPRQVGKTTLCREILKKHNGVYLSCDNPAVAQSLAPKSAEALRQYLGEGNLFILDEAQRVENIGLTLKILADNYPDIQIIATGSSSFELANTINEPLTGRNIKYYLFPLSIKELANTFSLHELRDRLTERLIYGSYPELVAQPKRARAIISEIASDYLYRDLLSYQGVRKPELLSKLLRLLALQIGNEVSYFKLAKELSVSSVTIESYIRLLEQAFIIFTLSPLATNKYSEVTKLKKIYFYDVGIRNTLIDNYNPFELRNDSGVLLENFFIAEKMKEKMYSDISYKNYFWRTKSGQEIDYVEEYRAGEEYKLFECKWDRAKASIPQAWRKNYPESSLTIISKHTVIDELIRPYKQEGS